MKLNHWPYIPYHNYIFIPFCENIENIVMDGS